MDFLSVVDHLDKASGELKARGHSNVGVIETNSLLFLAVFVGS